MQTDNSGTLIFDISDKFRQDERGWSVTPEALGFEGVGPQGAFHIVSMVPDCIRGSHKHLTTSEWIAVWGADIEFIWEKEGDKPQKKLLERNKAYMIFLPKEVYHAFKNVDCQDGFLFSYFMTRPLDYEKEIIRKVMFS